LIGDKNDTDGFEKKSHISLLFDCSPYHRPRSIPLHFQIKPKINTMSLLEELCASPEELVIANTIITTGTSQEIPE